MEKKVFENKIKPVLTYIGAIGALLTSCAYIVLMIVLIKGFHYEQTKQAALFSIVNAGVGLIIANFLKYQGITFAKELPENEEIVKKDYATKTKDKKPRSMQFYWTTSIIKDIKIKLSKILAQIICDSNNKFAHFIEKNSGVIDIPKEINEIENYYIEKLGNIIHCMRKYIAEYILIRMNYSNDYLAYDRNWGVWFKCHTEYLFRR